MTGCRGSGATKVLGTFAFRLSHGVGRDLRCLVCRHASRLTGDGGVKQELDGDLTGNHCSR
jgi:hypothetical protein